MPDPNYARHPRSTDRARFFAIRTNSISNRLIIAAIAIATLVPLAGCKGLRNLAVRDAVMISYRDMVWAKRAYNLRYGNCNRPYGDHFQNGFCAGYSDVCNGGDGYVPAMPPQDYRSYEYQSAEGVHCVNAWFEGYPAGVSAARKEKLGGYNDVLISKMIDSAVTQENNVKRALPQDVPVLNSNGQKRVAPPQPPVASMMTPYDFAPDYAPSQFETSATGSPAAMNSQAGGGAGSFGRLRTPMETGSGLNTQSGNAPSPMAVQSATYESNRRSR